MTDSSEKTDVNGHTLKKAGEGTLVDTTIYECVDCGKIATSTKGFERMDECKGE